MSFGSTTKPTAPMANPSQIVLTQEQAELLLPLLPTLHNANENGSNFTVAEMFSKKRVGHASQAQNYLLVSLSWSLLKVPR